MGRGPARKALAQACLGNVWVELGYDNQGIIKSADLPYRAARISRVENFNH